MTDTPSRLPNADTATVAEEKITRYLLDETNPRSRGKPAVFFSMGYRLDEWQRLRDDLLTHGRAYEVAEIEVAGTATVYNVEGDLHRPEWQNAVHSYGLASRRRGNVPTTHYCIPRRKEAYMNEYDEVKLTTDRPDWHLQAGARGAVVDVVPGNAVVAVEFYGPNEENAVHLVPVGLLRVTKRYHAIHATAAVSGTDD